MDARPSRVAETLRGTPVKYVIAAVAAVALLTACAGTPAASPTVTVTEERVAPAPQQQPDPDDLYMALLAESGVYSDRQTAIEVGHTVCDALDDGYEPAVLALLAVDAGFTDEQAAGIVAAAIVAYCPWNRTSV